MLRQLVKMNATLFVRPLVLRQQQPFAAAASAGGGGSSSDKHPKTLNNADIPVIDFNDPDYLPIPEYPTKTNESLETRKLRLIYQSRKRGMLENDLLLSTFISKHLNQMSEQHILQYDRLINGVTNDWEIYYWATKAKPTPAEFDNDVMDMLKKHAANAERVQRFKQPNL